MTHNQTGLVYSSSCSGGGHAYLCDFVHGELRRRHRSVPWFLFVLRLHLECQRCMAQPSARVTHESRLCHCWSKLQCFDFPALVQILCLGLVLRNGYGVLLPELGVEDPEGHYHKPNYPKETGHSQECLDAHGPKAMLPSMRLRLTRKIQLTRFRSSLVAVLPANFWERTFDIRSFTESCAKSLHRIIEIVNQTSCKSSFCTSLASKISC